MRELLGKGANLAEMTNLGLPVREAGLFSGGLHPVLRRRA